MFRCFSVALFFNIYAAATLVKTPVKLLFHNDLDLATAPQHQSFLLLSKQTHAAAQANCASLNETLLTVQKTAPASNDLASVLRFEAFDRSFTSSSRFWILGGNGLLCNAVDANGRVTTALCIEQLPALCTQSAPLGVTPQANNMVTVSSKNLQITGFRDQKSFRFLGIPYANKPERFTYSTLFNGSNTLQATKFGSNCVQTGQPASSEDCLFLNIFTPTLPGTSKSKTLLRPVMFWIHGGAFTGGEGSDSLFDGGNYASRGEIVTVTINYRLSTLGFLALEDGVTNGNFGLADQITALDWVREHITAFGGDPDRITIFGQSAGAASVRALMASPKAIGKFAAAIPMSNLDGSNFASTYSNYFTIPEEVATAANQVLSETGCANASDQLACLRAFDPHQLVSLPDTAKFLVVDGTFLTSTQLPLNGSGPIANVHTMMGIMRDDGAAFISFPTDTSLTDALNQNFLPLSVVNNSLFPVPPGPNITRDNFNVTARVTTNVEFRCLDQATAFSAINHNLLKSVFYYEFNRSYQTTGFSPNFPNCEAPIDDAHPLGDPSQEYFKCHSGELYYVFGTLPSTSDRPYRDDIDLPFMQEMVDIWTSFARTFDPNPDLAFLRAKGFSDTAQQFAQQSKWTPVTKNSVGKKVVRQLQFPSFMTEFRELDQCGFLNFPVTFYG
ncbi:carboxylesterase from carbohydrate esterase [Panus rudis PR-1116 ss-1]|nr:carboxylesterase from carbohydrate esterase [Panus rudis PR-1116 ss-1]